MYHNHELPSGLNLCSLLSLRNLVFDSGSVPPMKCGTVLRLFRDQYNMTDILIFSFFQNEIHSKINSLFIINYLL